MEKQESVGDDRDELDVAARQGVEALGAEYMARMTSAIPQRRLGSVEDVAYAALFLASDEAGFISGQTIVVDGGQVLPESHMALEDL